MTNYEPIMARQRALVLAASHPIVRKLAGDQLTRHHIRLGADMREIERHTREADFVVIARDYRDVNKTLLSIYQSYYRCVGASGIEVHAIDAFGRPVLVSKVGADAERRYE